MKTVYVLYKLGHFLSKVYTIKGAAQALGIHPKTLRRWEEKGKFIPSRTLGNQRRFSDKDLNLLAKVKAGEPIPLAPPKILTLEQTAAKLHVSTATVQRWTKEGKLKIRVNDQLQPGYYAADLQGPSLQTTEEKKTPEIPSRLDLVGLPTRSNLEGRDTSEVGTSFTSEVELVCRSAA